MKPSLAPLPVPAETLNVRAELDAASGPHAADARRALELLSESSDQGTTGHDETPPLPDRLRSRWQEAYGPAAPAPRAGGASEFVGWLRSLLAPQRLAWAGGLAAVALVAIMAVQHEGGGGLSQPPGTVTRGTSTGGTASGEAAPIFLVSGESSATAAAARLHEAFPQRSIQVVPDARNLPPASTPLAVVIDPAAGSVTLFNAGNVVKSWPVASDALAQPDGLVSRIEDADEAAAAAAPAQ